MTADWVARHLTVPAGVDRVVLPGFCRGDVDEVPGRAGRRRSSAGRRTCATCPSYFGKRSGPPPGYGAYDIEILAEINHAPQLTPRRNPRRSPALPRRAGPT